MIKLQFEKDYKTCFAKHKLESFENIFSYAKGSLVGKNSKRDVTAFALENTDGKREFFMKRFMRPHFKDMFFTACKSGHLCSQGQYEWESANFLLKNGIMTYRPVCYGTQSRFGIESRSFFVTEKLTGQCLREFITEKWEKMSAEEKYLTVKNIGKFVRKLHHAGVNMPDLYVWHLYLESEDVTTCDFAIIDLHRMSKNRSIKSNQIVRNLAALNFSMIEKYFNDEMRYSLVESYLNGASKKEIQRLYKKINRRTNILRLRRHAPVY
ncbi:MAG: lipopolysaccharide kinase InaA family protein [Phycisphaerae bacterium]|nr:lipopolysaccharide kinase InaA family protein [Phycisphaerae bacterium]